MWAWGSEGIDGTRANVCGDECTSNASAIGRGGWPAFSGHHDDFPVTAPVDSTRAGATPEGLLHMTGNVWEWTSTADGTRRVYRGGAWDDSVPSRVRAAARSFGVTTDRISEIGFRCARGGM